MERDVSQRDVEKVTATVGGGSSTDCAGDLRRKPHCRNYAHHLCFLEEFCVTLMSLVQLHQNSWNGNNFYSRIFITLH